jgi:hypothetical protein
MSEKVGTETGKRVKRQTEFFKTETKPKQQERKTSSGDGTSLGDYPFFVEQVAKLKGDDEVLKGLHTIIYNTPGKKLEVKKHLKVFNGFHKDANLESLTEKVVEKKKQWTVANLKTALGLFGLEKGGEREVLCKRLVEYLATPEILKNAGASSGGRGKKRKSTATKKDKTEKKVSSISFITIYIFIILLTLTLTLVPLLTFFYYFLAEKSSECFHFVRYFPSIGTQGEAPLCHFR